MKKALLLPIILSFLMILCAVCVLAVSFITDFGDAPASRNDFGNGLMTAYLLPSPVTANFSTVHNISLGAPYGPCHNHTSGSASLGTQWSGEVEADLMPDSDGVPNINVTLNLPDRDSILTSFGMDDGLAPAGINPQNNVLPLNNCSLTTIFVLITNPTPSPVFLNIWIDYNRDGDWGLFIPLPQPDNVTCPQGDVPEWVLQNALIPASFSGPYPATFTGYVPQGQYTDVWMRVQLTESPVPFFDGSGHPFCYEDGETEDYYVELSETAPTPPQTYGCNNGTYNYTCGENIISSCNLTGNIIATGTCFNITKSNITVDCKGFNITGSGAGTGIKLDNVNNVTVVNCTVSNFTNGIYIDPTTGGSNNKILNNIVYSNLQYGIFLENSPDNYLYNNKAYQNNNGISLLTTNPRIPPIPPTSIDYYNQDFGVSYSPPPTFSDNNTIINNTVFNNSENGIYLNYSYNNSLINNTANYNLISGIVLQASVNNTLTNNTANNNNLTGILLVPFANNISTSNKLINNTANNNSIGIGLLNSSNNTLLNNNAANNSLPNLILIPWSKAGIIIVQNSNFNNATNNTLSNNTIADLAVDSTSLNNKFLTNTVSSYPTTFSFTQYYGNISIKGVQDPIPSTSPLNNVSKFINITNILSPAWLNISIYYDSDFTGESSLLMYRYNGTGWENVSGSDVDTINNFVYGNISNFSVFAPLYTPPPIIVNVTNCGYIGGQCVYDPGEIVCEQLMPQPTCLAYSNYGCYLETCLYNTSTVCPQDETNCLSSFGCIWDGDSCEQDTSACRGFDDPTCGLHPECYLVDYQQYPWGICLTDNTICDGLDEYNCGREPACSISTNNYYVLQNDIYPQGGHPVPDPDYDDTICFRIVADNVVFDCNGHKITGIANAQSAFYASGVENLTIKNCVIDPEEIAVDIRNSWNVLLDNINVSCGDAISQCTSWNCDSCGNQLSCDAYAPNCAWNFISGLCEFGDHPEINNAVGLGYNGIGFYLGMTDDSVVQNSGAEHCGEGFFIEDSRDVSLYNNTADFNNIGYKWAGSYSTNEQVSADFTSAVLPSQSTVSGNTANFNARGFFLFSGTHNLWLDDNSATYNYECGFCTEGSFDNKFKDENYAYWNKAGYQFLTADNNFWTGENNRAYLNIHGIRIISSKDNYFTAGELDYNCNNYYTYTANDNIVEGVNMHDPYWNDVFETYTPDVELITDNGQKGTLYINQLENTITKYNFTDSKPIFLETGYGMLEFTDEVTQNGTNLSSDISITSNRIYVNSSGKPGFNVSAHLEFYSLGYESYPTVAFNDVNFYNCSIYPDLCTNVLYNFLYDGGTLEFDVSHWTTYSTNPYPALSVQLVYPLTAKNVEQNKFFTFTANITCNNGDCGNVTAYVDPQQQKPINLIPITGLILIGIAFTLTGYLAFTRTRMPMANKLMVVAVLTFSFSLIFVMTGSITGFVAKDYISTNPGDTPFYTTSPNPQTGGCLDNMVENAACQVMWSINATGPINTTYEFFVESYATAAFGANSSKVNITIVEQGPPYCDGWDCLTNLTEDFMTTGRHGGSGWKNAIWDKTQSTTAPMTTNNEIWADNVSENFTVSYNPATGNITYTQETGELTWFHGYYKAFEYIIPFVKGASGKGDVYLHNMTLNGEEIADLYSNGTYKGLKIYLADSEQINGFTLTGKANLTRYGSPKDETPAFHVFAMNTHNLSYCGNSIIDEGEECDGSDLAGETCASLGYSQGTLSCTASCAFTGCSNAGGGGGGHGGGGGVPVSLKPGCSSKECTKCADKNSCIAVGCEWDNTRCIFKTAAIPSVPAVTVPTTEVPEEVPPTEEAPVSIFEEIPMWLIMLIIIIGLLAVALFLLLFFREGIIPEKQKIHEIRQKYPHHVKALDDYMVKARSKHYSKEHVEKLLIHKGRWNKNFVKSYLDMYYKK